MATDQEIRDAGILYLPLQKYLANPFQLPQNEEGDEDTGGGGGGIPFTNVGLTGGGGGGGGGAFGNLNPTFSSLPGDPSNFRLSQLEGEADYFPPTTALGKTKNFFMEKFFQPKVRGTLGDRLLAQSQGMTIPSLSGAFAKLRSPFNPDSPTYNAAFPSQLNFLEAGTGTRVTGTSDNLKFTDGLNLIGRDPNTGGLKYGPGSVLAGKNVISGFGTNDYETALNDYISKMISRGVLSKFQQAKLDQARKELADLQADQEKKYRTSGTRDEVINLQRRIDRGETDINREAANNESPTGASLVNPNSAFGKSQGYTGGNPNPHTPTGWSGSTKGGNGGNGGNGGGGGNPTGSPGSEGAGGSDEMGSFRRGGLAGILGF